MATGGCEVHIPPVSANGKQHQYELGPADLTDIPCSKNPGHINFIPRTKFKLENLPPGYQDQLIFDFVDTTAELTGLLTVRHVSEGRPETFPATRDPYPCGTARGQAMCQTGTGFVRDVEPKLYTQVDGVPCPCGKCAVSETPSSTWGRFCVLTAAHVLVDDIEVRESDMRLFYKSGGMNDPHVKVANGVKVECSDIGRDWCTVVYVTHERSVHDTLRETWEQWLDLQQKLCDKYWRYNNNKTVVSLPAVMVSHPHASHQHISVGKVTHVEPYDVDPDYYRLTYSTDTCPGSSGATVLVAGWYDQLFLCHHPHSRACPPGQQGNQSVVSFYSSRNSSTTSSSNNTTGSTTNTTTNTTTMTRRTSQSNYTQEEGTHLSYTDEASALSGNSHITNTSNHNHVNPPSHVSLFSDQQPNPPNNASYFSDHHQANPTREVAVLEKYREQLLSVEVPGEFYRSPAYLAVRNIYGPNSREKQMLLEMTVKLLSEKHKRDPTLEEMCDLLFEDDTNEQTMLTCYADVCTLKNGTQQNPRDVPLILSPQQLQSGEQGQQLPAEQPEATREDETTHQPSDASVPRNDQEQRQEEITAVQVLKKEHEYLHNKLTCVGCRERPINVVFLPCGHFAMCDGCSMSHNICPMCKKTVLAETKTYLS